jgi:hypothetical protein
MIFGNMTINGVFLFIKIDIFVFWGQLGRNSIVL